MKGTSSKKQEPVSKLYAKALFELAQEKNQIESVQENLLQFSALLQEQPQLKQALTAFMFSVEDREKVAKEICQKLQVSPLLARFVELLIAKNRLQLLPEIYDSFRGFVDESKNTVRGTVATVEPLTDAETTDLSKAFAKKLNKQVVLDPIINKEILGGLIVKIQGLTFDGSLKTTIRRLKETLERQSI